MDALESISLEYKDHFVEFLESVSKISFSTYHEYGFKFHYRLFLFMKFFLVDEISKNGSVS
jgi:hypothetical protein